MFNLAHNVLVIMLSERKSAEHNPHYTPFLLKKGGIYGISSSSCSSCTVSHGCSQTVPSSCTALLMYCTNPGYISRLGFIPCGKCEACLIARKKEWSDRLFIESISHKFNYFVTLTYDPEHYPADGSLSRKDLKLFVKRLGYFCHGVPQFFACGEYGDTTSRAHYHLAIFSDKDIFNEILKSWKFGRVGVDSLTLGRCKYVCGYVVKKMTKKDDERLDGRSPEFFSASRRPPLGYSFLFDLLHRIATDEQFRRRILTHVYPPYSVKIGGRSISLPRYVREKLRFLWVDNEELQEQKRASKRFQDIEILTKITENLQSMYELTDKSVPFKDFCKSLYEERNQLDKKAYNFKQRKKL